MFRLKSIIDGLARDVHDQAMVAQAVVDAPPDEVFSYVTDFDRAHEWFQDFAETEKTSQGPVDVGSTFRAVWNEPFRSQGFDVVVTEYTPDERLGFKAGRLSTSVRLEPDPASGGTRVTVRRDNPLPPVYPWWWWLLLVPMLPLFRLWGVPLFRRKIQGMGSLLKEYYQRSPA